MKRRNFLSASALPLLGVLSTAAASSSDDNEADLGAACSDLRPPADADTDARTRFARWYCDMWTHQWPRDWGAAPEAFRRLQQLSGMEQHKESVRLGCFKMAAAFNRLAGVKECTRVWHVETKGTMTNAEFEKWWPKTGQVFRPNF